MKMRVLRRRPQKGNSGLGLRVGPYSTAPAKDVGLSGGPFTSVTIPPISPGDALLMQTGDFLLLENGDKILLEA